LEKVKPRRCRACKRLQEIECFYKKTNGWHSRCKECFKGLRAIYRKYNREKVLASQKKYRLKKKAERKKWEREEQRRLSRK